MNKSTQSIFHSFVLTVTFFVVGHAAYAASFNCDKAQTQVEKLICADSTLSADDNQLAELFKIPKENHLEHDDPIYVGQRAWLKNIRNVCTTADCLHTAYQKRIGYLKDEIFRRFHKGAQCELPSPIMAKSGCKIIAACAENADYSFLQAVISQCENEKVDDSRMPIKRDVSVYYYQNKDAKPIVLKSLQVEIWQESNFVIAWLDTDRNGFAALYFRLSCGISDCSGETFRYDPEKNEMYPFYEGSSGGVQYFDGYLIDGGKSGCCSSEVQARKVHQVGSRDVVEDEILVISTYMEDETHGETCSVSEYGKDYKTRPAKLPNKKWLKFCATAGYNK